MSTILMVSDLRDLRVRKQKELEFYGQQLADLQLKMSVIKLEVDLTTRIIDVIEREILAKPVWARVVS